MPLSNEEKRTAAFIRTAAIELRKIAEQAPEVAAEVRRIAEENSLWLFEDTCESLGVVWEGQQVGSFGHVASFSFYFAHHITTIDAMLVIVEDKRVMTQQAMVADLDLFVSRNR